MIRSSLGRFLLFYFYLVDLRFISNGAYLYVAGEQWTTLVSPGSAPTISPSPSSILVNIWSVVYLPCEVAGIPTPEVSWKRGEMDIVQIDRLRYIQREDGLVITDANHEDNAIFTCSARNSFGLTSKSIKINISNLEHFLIENRSSFVLDSFAKENCSWFHNGKPIPENGPENKKNLTLTIHPKWKNEGTYKCKTDSGIELDTVRLTISRKPEVDVRVEKEISIKEGDSLSISCNVTGIPLPVVTWRFNGNPNEATQRKMWIKISSTKENHFPTILPSLQKLHPQLDNTLVIRNADVSLEGMYTCKGKNFGGENNKTISVTIIQVPVINDGPSQYEVVSGESIQIQCKVDTKPTPRIMWYFNDRSNNYKVDHDGTLTITNADSRNSGQLRCYANNTAGDAMKNFTLNVVSAVGNTEALQFTSTTDVFNIPTPPVELNHMTVRGSFGEDLIFSDAESEKSLRVKKNMDIWTIPEDMIISKDNLSLGGPILGAGHFGVVTLSKFCGTDVACKTINDNGGIFDLFTEGKMVGRLHHPRILALYGIAFIDWCPILVTEYLKNGSLDKYIINNELTTKTFLKFAKQIAEGMEYLHSFKMIHRDLAARNCMLDAELNVKIGDFGLARECNEDYVYVPKMPDRKLPLRWMAIEILESQTFTQKCDIWAYGVVLWEMFNPGKEPYPGVPIHIVYEYLKDGNRLNIPIGCPETIYENIMKPCWKAEMSDRPDFSELLRRVKVPLSADDYVDLSPQLL